ncbi:hypothetical protein BGW36DRAFT_373096 [Talaromyces proteolyticus]|uniref:Uncharacterized protein n=1 Tax=Talaromyces proteolyticus TaxID=1131652 RepID=A0AAD4L1U5_9EURO|nr:uncharacterized protein BGW36DRAFT_373096 [Talaromyces proteolyticus]KAH8702566.1 hypothetical protein BGW36DRAFT_373096 [Talaromyces proteolyticus]
MDTTEIDLHEAALLKAQKHDFPTILTTDAISKCMAAANDIVDAIQFSHRLKGRKLESFRQLNNFQVWPCTRAIQLSCHIEARSGRHHTFHSHLARAF